MTTSPKVERMLPLYEAKMIHHYDHRWATYESNGEIRDVALAEKQDATFSPMPRYWVREEVVNDASPTDEPQFLGVRDITNSTNERTVIAASLPRSAVGNNLPLVFQTSGTQRLQAVLSSFALDFIARPKVGGVHLNFFIANQLAVLSPGVFEAACPWGPGSAGEWVDVRVGELVETSNALARQAPYVYDPARRALLRAELDAALFHLYGVTRDDVDYIMETFPIVKRKDIAEHGEFRTKRLILEVYDKMQAAIDSGTAYQTILDPPPGEGPRHPEQES